jgi:hypothetical protein
MPFPSHKPPTLAFIFTQHTLDKPNLHMKQRDYRDRKKETRRTTRKTKKNINKENTT